LRHGKIEEHRKRFVEIGHPAMRKALLFLALSLLAFHPAIADEQTQSVQQTLKDQGFYYGSVDGQMGTETTAAIRRYQIRNGLEVTGKLNSETLESLKVTGGNTPPAVSSIPAAPAGQENGSGSDLQAPGSPPDRRVVESDKQFLDRPTPPPSALPRPPSLRGPDDADGESGTMDDEEDLRAPIARGEEYGGLFARTPYESAPPEVQRRVFLRIQSFLYREGFYRGPIDGIPGAGMERAIRSFQADADLPRSGRLDIATLAEMRMLPGRGGPFPTERRSHSERTRRVYRGIWVR
jgi:peptidoglycan hydrolase-like protein with peptidoglycan-binding domain